MKGATWKNITLPSYLYYQLFSTFFSHFLPFFFFIFSSSLSFLHFQLIMLSFFWSFSLLFAHFFKIVNMLFNPKKWLEKTSFFNTKLARFVFSFCFLPLLSTLVFTLFNIQYLHHPLHPLLNHLPRHFFTLFWCKEKKKLSMSVYLIIERVNRQYFCGLKIETYL